MSGVTSCIFVCDRVFFERSSSTVAVELCTNTLKKQSLVAVWELQRNGVKRVYLRQKVLILEHDSARV